MRLSTREGIALVLAVLGGLAIGWLDSRPTFDDTGVTGGLLVTVAGISALTAPRLAWLVAILVGLWTPLFEIPMVGRLDSLAAFILAAGGAIAGWIPSRLGAAPGR